MRFISRSALGALVAMFAMSAVGATAASAAEGPFYKITGVRLLAGESREVKAKLESKEFIFIQQTFIWIRCTKQKLGAGAEILGSTGANAGSGKETLVFEGCSAEGNGSACRLENETITTTTLSSQLVYASKERTGKVLVLFKPVSGSIFATLKFTGAGCIAEKTLVSGSVAAEVFSGGQAVEVGKESEAIANEVNFPTTLIKHVWVESNGVLQEQKPVLKYGNSNFSSVTGKSELTLAAESRWGIYTK
jgi:hypothetical protein